MFCGFSYLAGTCSTCLGICICIWICICIQEYVFESFIYYTCPLVVYLVGCRPSHLVRGSLSGVYFEWPVEIFQTICSIRRIESFPDLPPSSWPFMFYYFCCVLRRLFVVVYARSKYCGKWLLWLINKYAGKTEQRTLFKQFEKFTTSTQGLSDSIRTQFPFSKSGSHPGVYAMCYQYPKTMG